MALFEKEYQELDGQGNLIKREVIEFLSGKDGIKKRTTLQKFTNDELIEVLKLVLNLKSQERIESMKQDGMNRRAMLEHDMEGRKVGVMQGQLALEQWRTQLGFTLGNRKLDIEEREAITRERAQMVNGWVAISKEMRSTQYLMLQIRRQLSSEAQFQQTFSHQQSMDLYKLAQADREFYRRLLKDLIKLYELPEEEREKILEDMRNHGLLPQLKGDS